MLSKCRASAISDMHNGLSPHDLYDARVRSLSSSICSTERALKMDINIFESATSANNTFVD